MCQPFIIKIKAYVFGPKCWLIKLKIFFLQSLNAWRFLLVALKVCIFLFNTFFTYLIYFLHFSLVSIFYCYIFCHLFSHNFCRSYYYFRRPCLIFLGLARNYTSFRFLFFIRIFCCMPSNCVSWVLRAIFVYFLSSGRRVVIPWDFFLCWIFCCFVIFTVGWLCNIYSWLVIYRDKCFIYDYYREFQSTYTIHLQQIIVDYLTRFQYFQAM